MTKRGKFSAFLPFLILIGTFAGCRGMVSTQPGPTGDAETLPAPTDSSGATDQPSSQFESTPLPGIPNLRSTRTLPPGLESVPPTDDEPMLGEVPAGILDEITADLVKRASAAWDDIHIVRAEAVVWNDGSLGCPKPGESYIQMLINGYWVVLEVEGQEHDYRVSSTGNFILCEGKGLPPLPPSDTGVNNVFPLFGIRTQTGGTPTGPSSTDQYPETVIAAVIEDLSERLKVGNDQIFLTTSGYTETQTIAPCGSTTLDKETGPSGEGITLGFEVLLTVGNDVYRYITIGGLAYYCGIYQQNTGSLEAPGRYT